MVLWIMHPGCSFVTSESMDEDDMKCRTIGDSMDLCKGSHSFFQAVEGNVDVRLDIGRHNYLL